MTKIKFLIGFSEQQISPVLDNCDKLFSIDNILTYVEIWDIKHADDILSVIVQTFGDCDDLQYQHQEDDSNKYDDMLCLDEWSMLPDDDELFHNALENLCLSLLSVSMNMSSVDSNDSISMSYAATNALEFLEL